MRQLLQTSVFAFGLLAVGDAAALEIFVDQTAVYRYVNATPATCVYQNGPCSSGALPAVPSNWFAYDFDDSGWFSGAAPFSSGPTGGTIFDLGNANGPFAPGPTQPIPTTFTGWAVQYDPFLRLEFFLTEQTALTIWLAVDNGTFGMYLNGVQATAAVNLEGAAFRWEHVYDVAPEFTYAGRNVFALQLEDHGGATGFVMMITANDAATNPVFTTNPPPPPLPQDPPVTTTSEPLGLTLFGLALAGLAAIRRRGRVA